MRLERDFFKILVVTLVLTFSISFVFAATITDDIHLNIQTTDVTGEIEEGTYAFVFNISTTSDCNVSNVVYTNSTTLTTDTRGIISYYLPKVNLSYDVQYYLCYYRDGDLKDSSKIARTPYTFRARNITLSGVEIDQDLDMGAYNITTTGTGFFSFLGSLVNRIAELFAVNIDFTGHITGTGNIITTGNVTADYFVGDGSLLTGISTSLNVNITSFTYNGSLFYNDSLANRTGYDAGNAICATEFSGSHMCTEFEIMKWFASENPPEINGDAWCSAGGPKYVPASIPVNDCQGWTYAGTVSYLGNYWHFNSTTGGEGRAINCGTKLSLACCIS